MSVGPITTEERIHEAIEYAAEIIELLAPMFWNKELSEMCIENAKQVVALLNGILIRGVLTEFAEDLRTKTGMDVVWVWPENMPSIAALADADKTVGEKMKKITIVWKIKDYKRIENICQWECPACGELNETLQAGYTKCGHCGVRCSTVVG